jgi:hypothetical protein
MDAYRRMLEERVILTRAIAQDVRSTQHLIDYGRAIMDCWDDDFRSANGSAHEIDR